MLYEVITTGAAGGGGGGLAGRIVAVGEPPAQHRVPGIQDPPRNRDARLQPFYDRVLACSPHGTARAPTPRWDASPGVESAAAIA